MRKILFMMFFIYFNLFSTDFGKMTPSAIEEIDQHYAKIKNSGFKIGESGVILRWFDKEHSSIIARAIVEKVDEKYAYLRYEVFDSLSQSAMPMPKIAPKSGDEVLMRYFYKRALLIAPNFEIYQKITSLYKNVIWLHPDLMAAQLIESGNFAPKKSDFKRFCAQYSVGVIYFVNKTKGQLYDCHSFSLLKEDYITGVVKKSDTITPFYSRFDSLKSGWLNIFTQEVDDFYDYYEKLLEDKIKEDEKSLFNRVVEFFEGI